MPWDGTGLFVAERRRDGTLAGPVRIAGGSEESVFQPAWSPDGTLHFVSDRTGWWNLYRARRGAIDALAPMEAEFGLPQWAFGLSTYTFLGDGRVACFYTRDDRRQLALLRAGDRRATAIAPALSLVPHPARPRINLPFM